MVDKKIEETEASLYYKICRILPSFERVPLNDLHKEQLQNIYNELLELRIDKDLPDDIKEFLEEWYTAKMI